MKLNIFFHDYTHSCLNVLPNFSMLGYNILFLYICRNFDTIL